MKYFKNINLNAYKSKEELQLEQQYYDAAKKVVEELGGKYIEHRNANGLSRLVEINGKSYIISLFLGSSRSGNEKSAYDGWETFVNCHLTADTPNTPSISLQATTISHFARRLKEELTPRASASRLNLFAACKKLQAFADEDPYYFGDILSDRGASESEDQLPDGPVGDFETFKAQFIKRIQEQNYLRVIKNHYDAMFDTMIKEWHDTGLTAFESADTEIKGFRRQNFAASLQADKKTNDTVFTILQKYCAGVDDLGTDYNGMTTFVNLYKAVTKDGTEFSVGINDPSGAVSVRCATKVEFNSTFDYHNPSFAEQFGHFIAKINGVLGASVAADDSTHKLRIDKIFDSVQNSYILSDEFKRLYDGGARDPKRLASFANKVLVRLGLGFIILNEQESSKITEFLGEGEFNEALYTFAVDLLNLIEEHNISAARHIKGKLDTKESVLDYIRALHKTNPTKIISYNGFLVGLDVVEKNILQKFDYAANRGDQLYIHFTDDTDVMINLSTPMESVSASLTDSFKKIAKLEAELDGPAVFYVVIEDGPDVCLGKMERNGPADFSNKWQETRLMGNANGFSMTAHGDLSPEEILRWLKEDYEKVTSFGDNYQAAEIYYNTVRG